MKKNVMVVAVFLAGLLGGATVALASSQEAKTVSAVPCAVDMCIIKGRCVACPE